MEKDGAIRICIEKNRDGFKYVVCVRKKNINSTLYS